jgi:hypothetical protein
MKEPTLFEKISNLLTGTEEQKTIRYWQHLSKESLFSKKEMEFDNYIEHLFINAGLDYNSFKKTQFSSTRVSIETFAKYASDIKNTINLEELAPILKTIQRFHPQAIGHVTENMLESVLVFLRDSYGKPFKFPVFEEHGKKGTDSFKFSDYSTVLPYSDDYNHGGFPLSDLEHYLSNCGLEFQLLDLLTGIPVKSLYLPYMNKMEGLLKMRKLVKAQEWDVTPNLLPSGMTDGIFSTYCCDPMDATSIPTKFDACIFVGTGEYPESYAEFSEVSFIEEIAERVQRRAILVVSNELLNQSAKAKALRKSIMPMVTGVIRLPEKYFGKSSILILDKSSIPSKVVFVNKNNYFQKVVKYGIKEPGFGEYFRGDAFKALVEKNQTQFNSDHIIDAKIIEENIIAKNHYVLSVERYIPDPELATMIDRVTDCHAGLELAQTIDSIIRPQAVPFKRIFTERTETMDREDLIYEITVHDLHHFFFQKEIDESNRWLICEETEYFVEQAFSTREWGPGLIHTATRVGLSLDKTCKDRSDRYRLNPWDVVLSIKGNVGKTGLIPPNLNCHCIPHQNLIIFRFEQKEEDNLMVQIKSVALFMMFRSYYGQQTLKRLVVPGKIPIIPSKPLMEILIPDLNDSKTCFALYNKWRCMEGVSRMIDASIHHMETEFKNLLNLNLHGFGNEE